MYLVIHSKDFILKNVTDKYANISTGILISIKLIVITAQSRVTLCNFAGL